MKHARNDEVNMKENLLNIYVNWILILLYSTGWEHSCCIVALLHVAVCCCVNKYYNCAI